MNRYRKKPRSVYSRKKVTKVKYGVEETAARKELMKILCRNIEVDAKLNSGSK